MKLKLNSNMLTGTLLLTGSAGYLYKASQLSEPVQNGEPGASFYPLILAALMIPMALIILFRSWREPSTVSLEINNPATIRALLAISATVLFIVLFPFAGYWIATVVYTFCIALIFETGRKYSVAGSLVFCLILSLIVTAAGWGFFVELFDLYLPEGPF